MSDRDFLRHTLATLAYRAAKALRDAPPGFATMTPSAGSRTPAQILAHMGDLFDWALSDAEAARLFDALARFDAYLAGDEPLHALCAELFQGPIADALTHTGQLTMLRRVAGSPIKGENYVKANIVAGRVTASQSAPPREFD